MPLKIWLNDGTRKLVLYDPRNMIASIGWKRNETFGFVVVPKPV